MRKNIAVILGDGIGPEVTQAAVDVLQAVAARFGHSFTILDAHIGGAAPSQSLDALVDAANGRRCRDFS